MLKFGLIAKKCYKKHTIEPICQAGSDDFYRFEFYCKDCNKVRTICFWEPKFARFLFKMIYKINCFVHRKYDNWLPF